MTATVTRETSAGRTRPVQRRVTSGHLRQERRAGWLFVAPAVIVLVVFLFAPILMAAWVSLLDWNGQSSPFSGDAEFVGLANYQSLLADAGLLRNDFMLSVRNTIYYVLFNVTGVVVVSFALAMAVNSYVLRGRSFFRTIFYFPAITSSVAISVLFLFLFQGSGVVNVVLSWVGVDGPSWFTDPRGVLHIVLGWFGVSEAPSGLADTTLGGLSLWNWLSGPSVAMCALITLTIWASSGTFMLFFLVGLQDIPVELEEATAIDGAGGWQRFRHLTLPLMRRSIVLVVTLALISSWQVFDQVFILSQGAPAKTTLTPAYISYVRSFGDGQFGVGAAVAFVLFAIIIVLTLVQRWVGRERRT
ncbi:carbohydrate ABC transporter permease [Jiangella sp. DSM 45060]|uniref:carbohydrate ABC transporter permease n=1 Tax=Jiangella sp. DSM 45060 TaxID=1798224 RepID=UPI00087A8345|nr:sugar ABC transporter permease [Jiangella sp. DSM 45060]SDS23407.1 carbohydrate ABC transporter membrane protein 1, CUT1 family [Jiangella sp. DSM 45060]